MGLVEPVLVAASGVSRIGGALGVSLIAAAFFVDARGFASAAGAFVLVARGFAASVFFAGLATFSAASAAAAAVVALAEVFRVLGGALALGAFSIGTAAVSFMAWAFFGFVVDTCRTP